MEDARRTKSRQVIATTQLRILCSNVVPTDAISLDMAANNATAMTMTTTDAARVFFLLASCRRYTSKY